MTDDEIGQEEPDNYVLIRKGFILTGRALVKGWAITTTLWLMGLYTVLAATSKGFLFNLALMIGTYGYTAALFLGLPLGWLLGYLLRPVRNQWVHIAVFFVTPTLGFWALGSLLGFGWTLEALGLWATVGFASAIGRLAVWNDVIMR